MMLVIKLGLGEEVGNGPKADHTLWLKGPANAGFFPFLALFII